MKGFADGTASVIYTVEDPGSLLLGNQAGTIMFAKFDATGAIIPGTQLVVDRGHVWSSAWNEADQCFYLIYSFKPGVGDVIGKVDNQGNLVDYQTIPTNTFVQIAANANGVFLGGTVQTALIAEGYSNLHTQIWSKTYPVPPTSNDVNMPFGFDQAFSASPGVLYMGALLNVMNGPQTWVILKRDTASGAIDGINYPGEEVTNFVTDTAENLYGFKKTSKKLFRLNADGTAG